MMVNQLCFVSLVSVLKNAIRIGSLLFPNYWGLLKHPSISALSERCALFRID
jgi:hypothetical protein